jgi:hypothetical protein
MVQYTVFSLNPSRPLLYREEAFFLFYQRVINPRQVYKVILIALLRVLSA